MLLSIKCHRYKRHEQNNRHPLINAAHNYIDLQLCKEHVAAEVKLEIMQKTAKVATIPEDKEHDPFADLDKDEELENNEIVVENKAESEGTA